MTDGVNGSCNGKSIPQTPVFLVSDLRYKWIKSLQAGISRLTCWTILDALTIFNCVQDTFLNRRKRFYETGTSAD